MKYFALTKRDYLMAALIAVAAISVFSLNWPFSYADRWFSPLGGESTVGADRVLRGEIPYRDFWTLYAPGHFYLLAFFFKVFGRHLMVEVIAASVFCALAAALFFLLVRALTARWLLASASAAVVFAALWNSEYYFFRFETYPPTILLLAATLLLTAWHYSFGGTRYLAWAAFCTGLIALNKHDVGVYTSVAIGAGLLAHYFLSPVPVRRPVFKELALFAGIELAVLAPVILYFAWAAGADAYQNIITFPMTDWRYSRPEHYPSLLPIGLLKSSAVATAESFFSYTKFTVPFLLNLLGVASVAIAHRRRHTALAATAVTCNVAFWLHFGGAHLQVNTHIVTMAAYASVTAAIFIHLLFEKPAVAHWRALTAFALLVLGAWLTALLARPAAQVARKHSDPAVTLSTPVVSGFKVPVEGAKNLDALVAFVNKNVRPDEPLYVGLGRHDALLANDMLTYFVLGRPIPVRYHDLHPAVADRPKAQQEMIAGLEATRTQYVVVRPFFTDAQLDQAKAAFQRTLSGVGATILDEYIRSHYAPVAEFPPYQVWARRVHPLAHQRQDR